MTLAGLALRNVGRNKLRAGLTVLGIVITLVGFVLLRTVLGAWTAAADFAAKDRLATRNKLAFIIPLPKRYIESVRKIPGVAGACFASWFDGKLAKHEDTSIGSMAVDSRTFLTVFDELRVQPADAERWLGDRRGALVGDQLAQKLGWKVGDTVTLVGSVFPGDWQFRIEGIYGVKRKAVDRSLFFFHWDYLNDSLPPGDPWRDHIGFISTRIADPSRSAELSQAIDKLFDDQEVQTLSMSERAMNLSVLGMVSALLRAVDIVSAVILVIMMLMLGNTIAMGARERTREFGVLRAIGFLPRHIALSVLVESLVLGGLGGLCGLLLSYPLVEQALGSWLEANMGTLFPVFQISGATALAALGLALGLGLAAGLLPAWRAARLNIINALRTVE